MFQFFVEGAFLTLLSGGLGMGGAAALMAALSTLPSLSGFDPPKLVPDDRGARYRGTGDCRRVGRPVSGAPRGSACNR